MFAYPSPFINNGSDFQSNYDSEPILLVPDLDMVSKLGPARGPESSSKTSPSSFHIFFSP